MMEMILILRGNSTVVFVAYSHTYHSRRPFVTPRVLAKRENYVVEEEYSDEEKEEFKPNRDHFVQDPALLREQRAEQRAAKYGQPRPQGPPRGDVVGMLDSMNGWTASLTTCLLGKPKGQGQDSQTVQNRRKKDSNKASRGNHNRRAGAERKLRQGMIPS
jgi:activating signal cointegrator complex subunit 2